MGDVEYHLHTTHGSGHKPDIFHVVKTGTEFMPSTCFYFLTFWALQWTLIHSIHRQSEDLTLVPTLWWNDPPKNTHTLSNYSWKTEPDLISLFDHLHLILLCYLGTLCAVLSFPAPRFTRLQHSRLQSTTTTPWDNEQQLHSPHPQQTIERTK